ncbi:MAG: ROK family protein [Clostridiales bacterium]|nr:ROK family protein [Clostridiales bacterium]
MLSFLRDQGEATVSGISLNTSIPLATVYRIAHLLLKEDLILQTEKISSQNGRQPTLYSINSRYANTICIIIEKTSVSVCLADMAGTVLRVEDFEFRPRCEKEKVLEEIHAAIRALLQGQWGIVELSKRVRVIHVAVEADVDIPGGRIHRFSGASCFDDFDMAAYFEARYGVPAYLNKLLFVEAVSSIKNHCRYSFDHYVYLHIGVGFGAAIIIDRKIYTGAKGKAGELVQLKLADGRSWEEAYNTGNLYQRLVRTVAVSPNSQLNDILMDSLTPARSGSAHSLMVVLDKALEANCAEAIALVSEAAAGWANAICQLNAFFDPEVVVIGGDVSSKTPNVFGLICQTLSKNGEFEGAVLPAEYETSLMDAVALGALDTLYEKIYGDLAATFCH